MTLLQLLKSIWKYIKEDKWKFYIFILASFILSTYWMVYPYLFGKAISSLVNNLFDDFTFYLFILCASYFGAMVLFALPRNYLKNVIELNFLKRTSKKIYEKSLNLPVVAFDKKAVGEIVNKITTDPDRVIELLGRLVESATRVFSLLAIFALAVSISWILTIELFIISVVIYFVSRIYFPRFKKAQQEIRIESDKIVSQANQTLMGIREVKGLGIKSIIRNLMVGNINTIYAKDLKNRNNELKYNTILDFIEISSQFVLFFTAGYLTYIGTMPLELFIAFETYVYRVLYFIRNLSELGTTYQRVVVSMVRIDEIINNRLFDDELFGKRKIDKINGSIIFENINFSYDDDRDILNNMSFKIEEGKKVAVVGKSGMGKSTIFNLLLNFYKPTAGKILIDNIDINEFDEDSLRKHVAVIRQDPYLFNLTIRTNFELVNPDITLDEIRRLCQRTCIDEYIESLPDQYDTLIGEGGINLSGGQKQRIAIARALAKGSKILLFDESTSALDNESQAFIKETINKLSDDHTIIIIAHRLSTIMDADIIYLVDQGKIVAQGSHIDLIHTSELYNSLYAPELIELNI